MTDFSSLSDDASTTDSSRNLRVDDNNKLPAKNSVRNLIAKLQLEADSTSRLPIQFYSMPNGERETSRSRDAHLVEEKSPSSGTTLVNDAHLSRPMVPSGLRREPSRRQSSFLLASTTTGDETGM